MRELQIASLKSLNGELFNKPDLKIYLTGGSTWPVELWSFQFVFLRFFFRRTSCVMFSIVPPHVFFLTGGEEKGFLFFERGILLPFAIHSCCFFDVATPHRLTVMTDVMLCLYLCAGDPGKVVRVCEVYGV